MLNISVFYYEVMKEPKTAYELAKIVNINYLLQTFDDALADIE